MDQNPVTVGIVRGQDIDLASKCNVGLQIDIEKHEYL